MWRICREQYFERDSFQAFFSVLWFEYIGLFEMKHLLVNIISVYSKYRSQTQTLLTHQHICNDFTTQVFLNTYPAFRTLILFI